MLLVAAFLLLEIVALMLAIIGAFACVLACTLSFYDLKVTAIALGPNVFVTALWVLVFVRTDKEDQRTDRATEPQDRSYPKPPIWPFL